MNNRSNRKSRFSTLFGQCVFLLVSATTAVADERDWFVELRGTNGYYASQGIPPAAVTALDEAQQQNHDLACFAFTPKGEWILLDGAGVQASSQNIPGIEHVGETSTSVAYSASGAWLGLYRGNGYRGPGTPAWVKVHDLKTAGHQIRSVSFVGKVGYVVLYDKFGVSYLGIPNSLAQVLDSAMSNQTPIRCVAFTGTDWICMGDDKWWTSDPELPASKIVGRDYGLGLHPRWIAFVPYIPFNAEKFGSLVRRTMAGQFSGGYECVVGDHGKVVVALAEGWARAPWEKVDPSLPMTVTKPMALASVSKTITAAAMLKLWEERAGTSSQFSLDDPFWPWLSGICPMADESVKEITIRQLLAHKSGFANDCGQDLPSLGKLLAAPLAHPPGAVAEYRNVNYYIARLVIEQIGQVDFSAYTKSHVLAPAGVTDMETHPEYARQMCYYAKVGQQVPGDDGYFDPSASAGPGSWYGSAADMALFVEGIRTSRVLSPATTATMFAENLGWDSGNPWTKGGGATRSNGRTIHTAIACYGDGVVAAMVANCDTAPNIKTLLLQAWKVAKD